MFSLQDSNVFIRIALGAGVGAAAGVAIPALVRRLRLRRLGFTSADLSSREASLKKWAEITLQKMPEKISLTRTDSHSWSKPSKYAHARAALEKLGLERNPVFVASPQKWVVEFWLSKDDGIFAAILDSPPCGIHTEFMVSYEDGSTVSFENTEDCGRRHLRKPRLDSLRYRRAGPVARKSIERTSTAPCWSNAPRRLRASIRPSHQRKLSLEAKSWT
jgi:hypothetical protein